MRVVVEEVVYHPVAELRREHLAHLRVVDDETAARTRRVASLQQLVSEIHQFPLLVHFEARLVRTAPLVASRVMVCLNQIRQKGMVRNRIPGIGGELLDRTNRLPVVAVVVVRVVVARIEVEVPSVVVVRVRDGRPVVAVRTGIVERSPVAVAAAGDSFRPAFFTDGRTWRFGTSAHLHVICRFHEVTSVGPARPPFATGIAAA